MQLRKHSSPSEPSSTSGYSLIELVVVMVLLSIIGGTSFFVVLESMRVYSRAQPLMEATYEADFAAARIMRDIRDIPDSDSIKSFGPEKFAFTSSAGENVTYEYSSGILQRNGQPLAENLQDFAFSYESAAGELPAGSSSVHLVRLRLLAQRGSEAVPMALTVFPRGLQR